MDELKLILLIMKRTRLDKFAVSFLIFFFVCACLLPVLDPAIPNLFDSLWFCFNVVTTIGLGDYTVSGTVARIVVIVLGLYGILMFAFIPGIITSYYLEKVNVQKDRTLNEFYEQLTHPHDLSDAQKKAIAAKVKKVRPK